jgi:hypothetical protein
MEHPSQPRGLGWLNKMVACKVGACIFTRHASYIEDTIMMMDGQDGCTDAQMKQRHSQANDDYIGCSVED